MKRPVVEVLFPGRERAGQMVQRARGILYLWMMEWIMITNYFILVPIYLVEHPVRVDRLQGVSGSGERNVWNTFFFWSILCVENLHTETSVNAVLSGGALSIACLLCEILDFQTCTFNLKDISPDCMFNYSCSKYILPYHLSLHDTSQYLLNITNIYKTYNCNIKGGMTRSCNPV